VCGEAFPGLDRVYGNPGNDTLYANFPGNDNLYGGYGDDTLVADAFYSYGNHLLGGGPGTDLCLGTYKVDPVSYTCNP
jgi:Ca2+-binding RTX toxin-like protein